MKRILMSTQTDDDDVCGNFVYKVELFTDIQCYLEH